VGGVQDHSHTGQGYETPDSCGQLPSGLGRTGGWPPIHSFPTLFYGNWISKGILIVQNAFDRGTGLTFPVVTIAFGRFYFFSNEILQG
jgi:hypothetical protein